MGRASRSDHLNHPVGTHSLGFGAPHDVQLFEPSVAIADMILAVLERRSPS